MLSEDFAASVQDPDSMLGDNAFNGLGSTNKDETVKETPPAPLAENSAKTDEPPQEGVNTPALETVPFHKHPRWIKQQQELQELRKFRSEEFPKLMQSFEEKLGKQSPAEAPQIPKWFSALYGNDQAMYQNYLEDQMGVRAQIKQELLNEQVKQTQESKAEQEKWSNWVNDNLQALEDDGLVFDRNELQKVALDYLPSDNEGNIDFRKAYNIMTEIKKGQTAPNKASVDAKKSVADMAGGKQRAEKSAPKFETSNSLKGKSWSSLLRD